MDSGSRNSRGWSVLARPPVAPWEAGYAVRRDWPDGTHDLVAYRREGTALDGFVARDREYWRWGPLRPARWTVVVVSYRDFNLHARRHGCQAPDCPTG